MIKPMSPTFYDYVMCNEKREVASCNQTGDDMLCYG